MLRYLKNVKPEDWPALLLRAGALALITVHLVTFLFIYQHPLFILTAVGMGLLLAREMYEDLSQRFFRLKAEEFERELQDLKGTAPTAAEGGRRSLLIEETGALKDISARAFRS
ncbi:hypothetical protein JMM63_20090 [Rhodovulum sulfidophilum]|uniref:Glutamine-fructose-6-phosphate aminotransferase n=1 Tax=Rhodovulum sulfidophilum TaxID=35806 RepID=A0A0D6B3R0_RHOSU|nr:hypothetical protein [Rhodovulum sulfidophilum]ANB34390.1 hypothetical protein A6W98_10060 [Rhodovulum sulfidophilum DSM 1374]ANB38213.1 hypothetical protein A6024_09920 [Rhodovulum sulfidophilum]MBK5924094.1 hypothetical protein [Rhodovulum sulfidophilum]MBL3553679.1 hypothetical protein [Rhodovulum sulfidophilum]MBL3561360.1 hypothetical protein [Rhodovulum sulfidophilum]